LVQRGLDWKKSCEESGVSQVIAIGVDVDDSRAAQALASQSGVFYTAGWHPEQEQPPTEDDLSSLRDLLGSPKAMAVGEIGLDYFERPNLKKVPSEVQRQSFALMLDLAQETSKPVVVHVRDAWDDALSMLGEFPALTVVMHCFTGDSEKANLCIERGYLLSFAGIVTFPNAQELRAAAAITPADRLLVETDAPYLTPVPLRGEVNLPGYVSHTAAALAALRKVDESELRAQLTKNTQRAFSLTDETLFG
jgi:TatD DNase family protein